MLQASAVQGKRYASLAILQTAVDTAYILDFSVTCGADNVAELRANIDDAAWHFSANVYRSTHR